MIIFDTETTGLIANPYLPLDQQPHIIEIGALRVNLALEVEEELSVLIHHPGVAIPEASRAIHGISQETLELHGKPPAEAFAALARFARGEDTWLGHNIAFDRDMLVFELRRLDWMTRFPWPWVWIDSMQAWPHRLSAWGEHYQLKPQTHRAIDDCRLLHECYSRHIEETERQFTR